MGQDAMSTLSQLEAEAARILERLRKLESVPVPSVAKMFGKTPSWVKANMPVIVLSAKSHRVRAVDIEAFQAKRTIWPKNGA